MTIQPPNPVQLAVDATHLQQVARYIQAQVDSRIRAVEQASSGLRQVQVATRDSVTRTCEVYLDGDTSTPVPCGLVSRSVVPTVNQGGWALQNGSDLVLLGVGIGRPRAKIQTTRDDQGVGAGLTGVDFTAANGGTVIYDTDTDGIVSMADLTSGRVTVRWSGQYQATANVRVANKATAGADVAEIVVNDSFAIARAEFNTAGVAHLHCSAPTTLADGDYLRVYVQSVGSSTTFGYNPSDTSGTRTFLAAHFIE